MNAKTTLQQILLALAAAALVSCTTGPASSEKAGPPQRVWPPAPNPPRIAFVGYIGGPSDVGARPSALSTLAGWLTGDKGESLRLRKPFAVALDEAGNLCIADTEADLVCYADFEHRIWRRFEGVDGTRFESPVAVARRKGVFYVADSLLGRVFAFDDEGRRVLEITQPLSRPVGLAVAGDTLYVVDAKAHAVFAFGLDGKFRFRFGQRGSAQGDFNFPTCICPDHNGHVLVTDTMNCRVEVFDRLGGFVSEFGSNGDTSGHFARPKGIAVDPEGHVYVVDAIFDNFQVFSPAGQLLLNVGEGGVGPGEFGLPAGIAIGPDGKVYVADAFNHRVQVFKYTGTPGTDDGGKVP